MEGGDLICSGNESQFKNHGTGLLEEFVGLADADERAFLRFGRKWVGLHVKPKSRPRLEFAEPISAWRALALRVRALYRIGANLTFERTGNAEDWTTLGVNAEYAAASLDEARFQVMTEIRKLVTESRLQPRLYWNPENRGQWQIDLDSTGRSNLLAVLIHELMLRIADKEGFAICSICHRTYVPRRRPTRSKKNYCDDPRCQRDRWKHLKREQRRRKHEEGNVEREKSEEKTRKR
jgi:hypothetical protein